MAGVWQSLQAVHWHKEVHFISFLVQGPVPVVLCTYFQVRVCFTTVVQCTSQVFLAMLQVVARLISQVVMARQLDRVEVFELQQEQQFSVILAMFQLRAAMQLLVAAAL
jgi:hypothetical protein